MNGSIFAIEARGSGAHRAPLSRAARVRRFAAGVVISALTMLGLQASPAWAAAADISKGLDPVQGQGFTPGNTFETGSLVRYRLRIQCSSNDSACVTGTVTDVLDPNLQFVQVIAPTVKNQAGVAVPITTTTSGQTVTVSVGTAAVPFEGGMTMELVLVARVVSRPTSGIIPNQASITVPGGTPVLTTVVNIQVPPPSPNYKVVKFVTSPSEDAGLGEPVTYRVAMDGYQLDNVNLVLPFTITDTYPANANIIDAAGGTVNTTNHTITWTITSINQVTNPVAGQCSYELWCNVWAKDIILSYSAPFFSAGTTVTNTIASDPNYVSGDLPPLTASANKALAASAPAGAASKSGPSQASAGNTIQYRVSGSNSGNTSLANFTVTDTIPTGVTNYQIVRTSYEQPVYPPSLGPVTYEALVGGVWTNIGGYSTLGVSTPSTTITLPAGATAWRMSIASLTSGGSMTIDARATIPADAAAGSVYTNCAAVSSTNPGTTLGEPSCVNTTVVAPFVGIQPYKAHLFEDPAQTSVAPGETFLWGIGVKPSGPNPLTSLDFADQLPAQFEYVTTRCLGGYGDGNGIQNSLVGVADGRQYSGPGCNNAGVPQPTTNVVNADGSTSLTWQDVPINAVYQPNVLWGSGNVWWIVIEVRVKPGTAVLNYTNQMAVGPGGSSLATACGGETSVIPYYDAVPPLNPDSTDWDKDGNTTEKLCRANDPVQVRLAAAAETTKWDKGPLPNALQSSGEPDATCPDWGGFTRYPCVAQTNPGGSFDYKFNIQNTGNMTLTQYVAYDILPVVGDTGVAEILRNSPRSTEWTPVLTGPIATLSEPAAADTEILYNLTSNPCRPEVAQGDVDWDWQGGACDNTWYTATQIADATVVPGGWSAVKSFKVLAFQATSPAAQWLGGEQIILNAPMLAPLDAPDSTKADPANGIALDLSIAWNSIAHREFSLSTDGSTSRLLASEPLKVGIIVPFKGVSVGDYVWYDADRDGFQSPDEDAIPNVRVELLDANNNVVQETTTDANGYYSFQYLTPGAPYTIKFYAPADLADPTKLLVFTTENKSGNTSNDPVTDNGTVPLDGTTGGDSDAIPAADGLTGSVTFTAPLSGNNAISSPTAGTVADNPGLDAGFKRAVVPVSIGDYVWYDNNRDGLQTSGEPAYVGMTVNLLDSNGDPVLVDGNPVTTTTDANGYYSFLNLNAGQTYIVEFVKAADESFTTQDVTVNPDDAKDSDADPTGRATVTAPMSGANKATDGAGVWADEPTIDAGIVKYNLLLDKVLTTVAPYRPGQTVTYTLTPTNDGPATALEGWSVTDLLPDGLTVTSVDGGDNYSCSNTTSTATCTSSVRLVPGVPGDVITVKATISATATGSLTNVAYVDKAPDDVTETVPLGTVPTTTTDTARSITDNDDEAKLDLVPYVSVGDYVWYDVNRDGLQTSGEPAYVGMTVNLLDSLGNPVLVDGNPVTTTTDADGYYSFTDLDPSTEYVIQFVKRADETFTSIDAGGVTTNSATGDLTDSDAAADGTVRFTTTATGANLASALAGPRADNPGIDAGVIRYNLLLEKALTPTGPYYEGSTVTYTLTPSNAGPVDAMAGWSVTDVLPEGLTLVSMVGDGYDCTTTPGTCVSTKTPLAAGKSGNVITVKATIGADVTGSLKNVAYVDKAPEDGTETIPLIVPELAKDTADTDTDNDAEALVTVASKVSIGDYVWIDTNRDGLQTSGESGIKDVLVTLTDASGTPRTTTTDASGYYWFDDLTPGAAYTLTFTKPSGYTWTTQDVSGDTADTDAGADSDVLPADGTVSFTAPASGTNLTGALVTDNPTLDAGLVELVSVGDYTWLDVNRDGIQDAGESPLAGVTVKLYDASGALVGTKVTDATGYYWFTDLLAGATYTIEFVKPAGYTYTPVVNADPTANKDGGLDSDAPVADGKVTFVAESTGANAPGATATDNPTIDAGFVELVSIGNYVWYDRNRDGLQGAVADEPVVAGVTVNLLDAAGNPAVLPGGAPVTTTTDANGFYSFTNLLAGETYVVEFVKPVDTVFTLVNAEANAEDTKDSDANTSTGRVTVVAPSTGANSATTPDNPTIDAGLIELVSIGDYVWYDRNRDGLQSAGEPAVPGVTVNLLDAAGNPAVLPGGAAVTTVTDANGFYSFNNLIGGVTYVVQFVKPADTVFTTQDVTVNPDDAKDSDADLVTGKVTVVAPVTGLNSRTTPDDPKIDAGLIELVSVGDYVWWDTNRDGLQDSTDVPLAGVRVHLLDSTGTEVTSVSTDANGFYSFTGLIGGASYSVVFDTPAQFVPTATNVSADTSNSATTDLTDSDPIAGVVAFTAPESGNNSATTPDNPGLDAGFIKLVSVGDYVWYDGNRDGVQDEGEAPASGVVVNLYDAKGVLVTSTTTDENGFYSFTDLLAGATYTIEFVKPADTVFTLINVGNDAADSDADLVTGKVTFTAPTDGFNSATAPDDPKIDAGLIELVSIGDYVWYDRNRDGLQGAVADEPVVAGVTVNLLDAAGNPAVLPGGAPVTTTTDANGFYSFTNLLAGETYVVEFVKPADTIFTIQDVTVNPDDAKDSDANEVTGKVTVVAPSTGLNSATTPDDPKIDAGLIELVSIGDYVWWDTNRDGLQTEGELPIPGITVNLLDAEGNPAVLPGGAPVTTTTDANGFYSFNNLIGGVDYVVQFVKPDNTTFTWMLSGDNSAIDSNADVNGLAPVTAPLTGENSLETPDDPKIDAGLVKLVSVGDFVWYDVNRDGIQGDGEAPVPGVTVNLYDDETGELLATAVTDENGFYSFTDLWAGASYTIEFVKPSGTSFTSVDSGDDALDSDADLVTGTVTFTAPSDGLNSAVTPDDPTIDAGLVKFNLTLTKVLSTTGVVYPGDTVTFTLTPHNDGPVDTLAGWSVTEVVPAGLTFVSMTGDGYTCTGTTCVADGILAAGADGNPITVTMTAGTAISSRNVAFVDKAGTEGPETNPLVTPTQDTDTTTSETDNDSEAAVIVSPFLPNTGTDVAPFLAIALGLMAAGGLLLAATRRRRATEE
jgi:uncharacterized repeat protein (TIGR01451 family)/fimbrial isopeptide formation D2 family protein/LPXTG-motif cell wall-anchored protein